MDIKSVKKSRTRKERRREKRRENWLANVPQNVSILDQPESFWNIRDPILLQTPILSVFDDSGMKKDDLLSITITSAIVITAITVNSKDQDIFGRDLDQGTIVKNHCQAGQKLVDDMLDTEKHFKQLVEKK